MTNVRVRVKSPARLHLGIVDLSGTLGRKYGSMGVTIDGPCTILQAERSKSIEAVCEKGVETSPTEIEGHARRVLTHFGIEGGVRIVVERDIPKHVGLGSTTQAALSVATAVAELYGLDVSVRELSSLLGRGRVSGIGTAAFESGGFIVDGGVRPGERLPRVLLRADFPEDWFFITVVPSRKRGMTEPREKEVFRKISAPPSYAKEISHLLVMKMLPALVERDIDSFGEALTEIQRLVGRSFSPYQAGTYHDKESEDLVRLFLKLGAKGSGQSSWGPTTYGLVRGLKKTKWLRFKIEKFLEKRGIDATVYCCGANNRGALVKKI